MTRPDKGPESKKHSKLNTSVSSREGGGQIKVSMDEGRCPPSFLFCRGTKFFLDTMKGLLYCLP